MNYEKARLSAFLTSYFRLLPFEAPGFPWRVRLHAKRRKTQGPTAQVQKTRCGRGIKSICPLLQAGFTSRSRRPEARLDFSSVLENAESERPPDNQSLR